jgi:hypothetical protein
MIKFLEANSSISIIEICIENQMTKKSPKNNSIEYFFRGVITTLFDNIGIPKSFSRVNLVSFPPKQKNILALENFNWNYTKIKSKKKMTLIISENKQLSEELKQWTYFKVFVYKNKSTSQKFNINITKYDNILDLKKYDDVIDTIIMLKYFKSSIKFKYHSFWK